MDLPPQQVVCLAEVIYLEARGESELGQRGVAHVVLNRAKKSGKGICAIVRDPSQFHIKFRKSYKGAAWKKAWQVANYPGKDPTGGARYFANVKVRFNWGPKLTTIIGNHAFYK